MSKKLYELISNVLGIPNSNISDNSSPENTDGWDSFKSILLFQQLEKNFHIKFTIDEIYDVKTVSDIKKHLSNHGINLEE